MLPLIIASVVVAWACYWAYKKFKGPVYVPGSVYQLAFQHPESFDDANANANQGDNSSNDNNYWILNDKMRLYHFAVPFNTTGTATSKDDDNSDAASDTTKPVVILGIHGGPSIAPNKPWALSFESSSSSLLSGTFYLYHARGCGLSTRPFTEWPTPGRMWPGMQILEKELGIGAQVSDIERIRRKLCNNNSNNNNNKIVLMGHSFGGFIATLYAAEFPQHVEALVLLAPASVLQLPPPATGSPDLFQIMRTKLQDRGNADEIAEFETFYKQYFDFRSLPQETERSLARRQAEFTVHFARAAAAGDESVMMMTPDDVNAMVDDDKIGGLACYATYLSLGMEHNYKPQLKEIFHNSNHPFPVLIVHGKNDMVPPEASKDYLEIFPNATFEIVNGANHFLHDNPNVSKLIHEWILPYFT